MLFVVVIAAALVSGLDPADDTPPPAPALAPAPAIAPAAVLPTPVSAAAPGTTGDPAELADEPVAAPAPPPTRDPAELADEAEAEAATAAPRPRSDPRPAVEDPWRDALSIGAAAAGLGCLLGCAPLACAPACPGMICASPIGACGGAVGGGVSTHMALRKGEERRPIAIGAVASGGVLLGAAAGGALGGFYGAISSTDPFSGIAAGVLLGGPTLGVLLAGGGILVAELMLQDDEHNEHGKQRARLHQ